MHVAGLRGLLSFLPAPRHGRGAIQGAIGLDAATALRRPALQNYNGAARTHRAVVTEASLLSSRATRSAARAKKRAKLRPSMRTRHAIVVAPPGFVFAAQGSVFAAPEPVGPICAAFARGGRLVMLVQTTRDLAKEFNRAVGAVGREDDLIVYLAAATTTRGDVVGLRVDGGAGPSENSVELRLLGGAVAAREPSAVLFVIEACHEGSADDPIFAAEHVDSIVRAIDARARGYGAMIGTRPESRPAPAWPFTRRVLAALDDPTSHDEHGAVKMSALLEQLRKGGAIDADVQSFAFVSGGSDLVIVGPPEAPSRAVVDLAPGPFPPPQRPGTTLHTSNGASRDPARLDPSSFAPDFADLPEPRPTQPSLPAIDPLIDLADDARERGALPEALAGYKAALMVAAPDDKATRATIYARIGELKRAQGKPREAELNFEKALAADPKHQTALDALVKLATESHEVRRTIDLRRKRLAALDGPDEQVAELRAIADIYGDQMQDPTAAADTLDEALAVRGKSRAALEGLRDAYERLQRWQRVVEVLVELAESAGEAKDRSGGRFIAADVALARLRDEARGLGLLEQALDDDPMHDKALRALVAVRTSRGEWAEIEAVYSRLVDRLTAVGDTERAWDISRKLGVLRRDKLHNAAGAVEAFTGAVRLKPENVDSRALLAEMHIAAGDEALAVAEFERITQYAPTRSSTYARLFGLHRRAGRTDRAWLAGSVLAELGNADMDQQLFVDQYRLDGPIRPLRSLDDEAWEDLLRAPGADDVVTDVLRAIGAAAAAMRVDDLRQARVLVTLDPARRQSATSTVTAVRSFHWAAQVLGVEPPDLYVMDNVPGGIAAVHAAAPTTALGPDVLRGLTTKDLAFLAGRHLTYYRPEHYSLVCYPTLNDLSALFLGAVRLILPDLDAPPHLRDAAARHCKTLAKRASEEETRRLAAAVERLQTSGGRVDLGAWIRSVELSAQRAGLLLCGDLAVATGRLRAETETRAIADLTLDEKRGDLLAFCVSDKLARARAMLGVDAHSSVSDRPPGELQAG
jgi:tetratricopeptide (TPR) repeat protein